MISIRPVDPREAGLLSQIALSAKAHWGYPERWMAIWAPHLTYAASYFVEHEGWVAADGGRQIGFYTLEEKNGHAWIENLWVVPEYIGRGIGRQLFLHAVDRARQRGFKTLQLEADPNALGFYEKMGMRKIGERQAEVDGHPRNLPILEIDL